MSTEEKYIKGFNNGYLLAKHEPILLKNIITSLQPTTDYLKGIFFGKEEYELEKSKNQLKEIQNIRRRGKDREQDLERG
jgi:hypothetical protein